MSGIGQAAVEITGLTKRYGERVAVDRLDVVLPAGQVTGFVGPNGAGKTTTIRMLLGLARPSAGSGHVLGVPLSQPAGYLPRVGALVESPAFYPNLSGRDNLRVLARLAGVDDDRVDEVLSLVDLHGRGRDRVAGYSLGMKQRLGIAAALLPDPDLLVLDEPTNGLDPAGIREVRDLLADLTVNGTTVFVSSHLLSELETVADNVVLVAAGRLRFSGSTAQLLALQAERFWVRTEEPADLPALAAAARRVGLRGTLESDRLLFDGGSTQAAQVNRLAWAQGLTLVEIAALRGDLEQAFFSAVADDLAGSRA